MDNVSLLNPELLIAVQNLVVRTGHEVAKKSLASPCEAVVIRSSSKPMSITDLNLLWDAMRCLETGKTAKSVKVEGWRQDKKLTQKVRALFNKVRGRRKRQEVRKYLQYCQPLVDRAEKTLPELHAKGAAWWKIEEIQCLIVHARRQIDQVDRRLLRGEVIPQEEKVLGLA